VTVRQIIAREVVEDIRSGMSRSGLIEKYLLTSKALEELVNVLVDVNAVSEDEIFGDLYFPCGKIQLGNGRSFFRYQVNFDAPVYDLARPEIHGQVRDLTLMGIGIEGLRSDVDDIRNLVILGDPFGEVVPVEFEAICRWTRFDENSGKYRAGFQVTKISPENFTELKKFIRLVEMET
jgi:hypothetical protein